MDNFDLLGPLAAQLHLKFVNIFYLLLPVFFALALVVDWFRNPVGSADFLQTIKRAFVATILLVAFQEISHAILAITSGIAAEIDNLNGLDNVIKIAAKKAEGYTLSGTSLVLGFNDLVISILTFLSYVILYVARYIIVALYHFMWLFLSITAPLLLLFHLFKGTSQIPTNLFKSMIEVASYKIVWAIMSAMMTSLAFGNAYAADGNYLTVILLNFIIAVAMLGTPFIVKSLVGGGLSAATESLAMGAALALTSVPARSAAALKSGTEVMNNTKGFASHYGNKMLPHMPGLQSAPPSNNPTFKEANMKEHLGTTKPSNPPPPPNPKS